jgi:hypothetical protein
MASREYLRWLGFLFAPADLKDCLMVSRTSGLFLVRGGKGEGGLNCPGMY